MSIFAPALSGDGGNCEAADGKRRGPLIGEIFELVGGDLKLLMIYKKIEIAAETGDWSLMNELYGEFKMARASMN
jgi:hypothetical protein